MLILLQDQCFLDMWCHHIPNVFNEANTVFAVLIIIDQIPSGQLSKQLIQDLDGSIALNKAFVLALREIWLSKLNSSKHIKVYTFLFNINYYLYLILTIILQFTSVEFTKLINSGDSLTYKTRMNLK